MSVGSMHTKKDNMWYVYCLQCQSVPCTHRKTICGMCNVYNVSRFHAHNKERQYMVCVMFTMSVFHVHKAKKDNIWYV